jgi:hypothetical protein
MSYHTELVGSLIKVAGEVVPREESDHCVPGKHSPKSRFSWRKVSTGDRESYRRSQIGTLKLATFRLCCGWQVNRPAIPAFRLYLAFPISLVPDTSLMGLCKPKKKNLPENRRLQSERYVPFIPTTITPQALVVSPENIVL